MKMKVVKLFVVAQLVLFYFSRSEFCYESHGLILNDQVLLGQTYKTVIARGILACSHKCLADPICTSYNYQNSEVQDGVCELNNGSVGRKELFEEKRGFAFVRMRRKTVGPLEISYYAMPLCTCRLQVDRNKIQWK